MTSGRKTAGVSAHDRARISKAKEDLHPLRESGAKLLRVQSQPIAIYKRMIAGFNANDLSIVREVVSEDIVYTLPGRSELAGTTRGIEPHLAMLRRARELSGGTLRLEPEALAVDGDYLFVWGTISAARGPHRLLAKHCVVYRFANERIVEGRTVPTDLYLFDEFWNSARLQEG
ncbi:MAG TPA: nuclear transport factor 2 family protein [Polyangiaceae bacterium]|nr:nuclear transport factor 2 family protein [Polyangiaceae bacterium]